MRDWKLVTRCVKCGAEPGKSCRQTATGGTRFMPHVERKVEGC